nr:MAG TPA: hypothetical protein [Caudoviricetes sp.]
MLCKIILQRLFALTGFQNRKIRFRRNVDHVAPALAAGVFEHFDIAPAKIPFGTAQTIGDNLVRFGDAARPLYFSLRRHFCGFKRRLGFQNANLPVSFGLGIFRLACHLFKSPFLLDKFPTFEQRHVHISRAAVFLFPCLLRLHRCKVTGIYRHGFHVAVFPNNDQFEPDHSSVNPSSSGISSLFDHMRASTAASLCVLYRPIPV